MGGPAVQEPEAPRQLALPAGTVRAPDGDGPASAADEAANTQGAEHIQTPSAANGKEPPCDAKPATKKADPAKAPRLEALDAPRWFCSCMIVCYHFYREELGVFAEWGSAWTQFFFVLSGFVLAYVEMARPVSRAPKISQLQYIRKRLVTVYPTYVFALLVKVLTQRIYHPGFDWAILPMHLLLIQSWIPICFQTRAHPRHICTEFPVACGPEDGEVLCTTQRWNGVAWFMSCLVIYWALLRPLARHFRTYSLRACYATLFGLWAVSIVCGVLQKAESVGTCTGYCYQVLWAALQGCSIGYYHVFVSGIVTARIFVLTAMSDAETGGPPTENTQRLVLEVGKAPAIFRYGGIIGYVIYALLVAFVDYQKMYLFYHNGGILPLMVLILLGCAVGVDPAATYLFRSKPLLLMSRFSYSQYLLQESVWDFTSYHIGVHSAFWQRVAFPVLLLVSAYFCERLVTSPYSEWQRWRQEKKIKGFDDWAIEKADQLIDRAGARLCKRHQAESQRV